MRLTVIIIFIFICQFPCLAQTTLSGQVCEQSGKALPGANIVAYSEDNRILTYTTTDNEGKFRLDIPRETDHITAIYLGFNSVTVKVKDMNSPHKFTLSEEVFNLREVAVTAESISASGDTLTYSVANFKEIQDRSIADVISKMPGLEVKSNGAIEYQGKAISNLYIEGLDLMGSQYSLASNNIPADKVKDVQVLENHQNIRSLKGVSFSEQAALNIVLKDDVKSVWSGLVDLGIGYAGSDEGLVYDNRIMGMQFSKKFQTLMMYKNNNTGADIGMEVQDISDIGGYQAENGLISAPEPGVPEFDKDRFTFNTSHLLAANMLWKTGKDSDIRLQLSGFNDKDKLRSESSTTYLSIDGLPIITEDYDLISKNNEIKGELCYTHNSEHTFVRSSTKAYSSWNSSSGQMLYNGQSTALMARPYKHVISEDLSLSHTTSQGNIWQFNSSTGNTYLPGQLLTIDGTTRILDINMFSTHNDASFSKRIRRHVLRNAIGFNFKFQNINGISWQIAQPYWEPSMQMKFASHRLIFSLKASYAHQSYKKKSDGNLWVEPAFSWNWDMSPTSEASFSYKGTTAPYEGTQLIDVPVFTSYRSVYEGCGSPGYQFSNIITAGYTYRNPVNGIFFNIRPMYVRSSGNILYENTIASDTYVQKATDSKYVSETYYVSSRLAKSFIWCRTRIGINASFNSSGYAYLLDGAVQNGKINAYVSSIDYSIRPFRWWTVEGKSSVTISSRNNAGKIIDWSHFLDFNLSPVSGWIFSIENELYHSNEKGFGLNYFCDLSLKYRRGRWEISLLANNIVGTSEYRRLTISATTRSYTLTYLRPREIILKFCVDF